MDNLTFILITILIIFIIGYVIFRKIYKKHKEKVVLNNEYKKAKEQEKERKNKKISEN